MNSRRSAIKKISAFIAAIPLAPSKAFACMGVAEDPQITIYTPKNLLKKFYVGNFEEFLSHQYKNKWIWSQNIFLKSSKSEEKFSLIENMAVAPIYMSSNIKYDKIKTYCSKIELIYKDTTYKHNLIKEKDVMYFISSLNCNEKVLPYFSTRFKMSSYRAEIYAALTFSDTETHQIKEIRVSQLPAYLKVFTCASITYEYVNA